MWGWGYSCRSSILRICPQYVFSFQYFYCISSDKTVLSDIPSDNTNNHINISERVTMLIINDVYYIE